ncbi:single-stranded DNA-binding protein [Candidatus Poribacteria bacterium]|nr:single-stranded DNA-binding protein [Candidatus Poribacteria bacterium]
MELNKVLLIGNLTRDPETRMLPSGAQVCKLGLAANHRSGSKDGERREEVLFIDVEAWAKTAELCAQYLRKGSQVLVEGRLKMDKYQTQSGEQRTKFLIVADRVQFGARPGGGEGQGASRGSEPREDWGGGSAPPSTGQHERQAPEPASGNYGSVPQDSTEDDLPF